MSPFTYYSLCVLSFYNVSGEEMDLSVIAAKPSRQSAV